MSRCDGSTTTRRLIRSLASEEVARQRGVSKEMLAERICWERVLVSKGSSPARMT